MEVKVFIIFTFLVTAAATQDDSIDYSKVIPRQEVPGFWSGRKVQPPVYPKPLHKFDRNSGRIVGGNEATPNSIPYQAGLLIAAHWWTSLCGGCLLSSKHVLTAAHCLEDSNSVQVVLGAHNLFTVEDTQVRETVPIANCVIHEEYDPVMLFNDVAMIYLSREVVFNDVIQPISLPSIEMMSEHFAGEIATVSGWGRTSDSSSAVSPVLRYTQNEIKSNSDCFDIFGDFVADSTMCSITRNTGSGICFGDSGGPLTLMENGVPKLVGCVSFALLAGCEHAYPTGYARITSFREWILHNMEFDLPSQMNRNAN